jgi:hypothetical protein
MSYVYLTVFIKYNYYFDNKRLQCFEWNREREKKKRIKLWEVNFKTNQNTRDNILFISFVLISLS